MSRILFKKEGTAKYISHLDLMRTMQRAFIRAGIQIKHTEGYNPHPYISFALPLSLGVESDCELMDFVLTGGAELSEVPQLLTKSTPDGITVLEAYEESRKFKEIKWLRISAKLFYDGGMPGGAAEALSDLYRREELNLVKVSKGKEREVNIAPMIGSIRFSALSETELRCEAVIAAQEPSLSPALMLSAIDVFEPDLKPDFLAVRRLEIYDSEKKVFR